jgi:DNA-binding NarL/FixJ family response regulator
MYLNTKQANSLARLMTWFTEDYKEAEIRRRVGQELLTLLQADYFASFVWDAAAGRFSGRVAINMADDNLGAYERYYQFRDPITPQLQARRVPTLVAQIMPQRELVRTEFFNDFLAVDGLYHGVNLYAYDGDVNIGDLRIWRQKRRECFDGDTIELLSVIQPAFTLALQRARQELPNAPAPESGAELPKLSERQLAIGRCVCQGLSDKEIAQELGVAFSTVRTQLSRMFEKLDVHSRTQLIRYVHQYLDSKPEPDQSCARPQ